MPIQLRTIVGVNLALSKHRQIEKRALGSYKGGIFPCRDLFLIVKGPLVECWHQAFRAMHASCGVHGVAKSQARLSDWTITTEVISGRRVSIQERGSYGLVEDLKGGKKWSKWDITKSPIIDQKGEGNAAFTQFFNTANGPISFSPKHRGQFPDQDHQDQDKSRVSGAGKGNRVDLQILSSKPDVCLLKDRAGREIVPSRPQSFPREIWPITCAARAMGHLD